MNVSIASSIISLLYLRLNCCSEFSYLLDYPRMLPLTKNHYNKVGNLEVMGKIHYHGQNITHNLPNDILWHAIWYVWLSRFPKHISLKFHLRNNCSWSEESARDPLLSTVYYLLYIVYLVPSIVYCIISIVFCLLASVYCLMVSDTFLLYFNGRPLQTCFILSVHR